MVNVVLVLSVGVRPCALGGAVVAAHLVTHDDQSRERPSQVVSYWTGRARTCAMGSCASRALIRD